MIQKYYEEELRYLYDSGKEFAKAHPDRARFLNIDAVGDRDPYVERLFEGFAFLAARIREKIDDSFPELTEGLINLLWPHFNQEVPSLIIIECKPRRGHLQEARILPRGTELLSNPVGPDAVTCKFITTSDILLNPINLTTLRKSVDTKGNASIGLDFEIDNGVKWNKLNFNPLRIYLHAEMPTALALYELLMRNVIKAEIVIDKGRYKAELDASKLVSPVGFSEKESLFVEDYRSFRGYELLLEYFLYPEKFLFVDITGIEGIPSLEPTPSNFSLNLTFNCNFPEGKPFGIENFRLHCSPAVNLFKYDAEPVVNTGRAIEYLVRANSHSSSYVPHSIISVTGVNRKTGEQYHYEPFYTFKNIGKNGIRTYTSHYRQGFDNKRELFIIIGGKEAEEGVLEEENLSIEIWCTNGVLPREELREGSISKGGKDFPDFVMVTNITRPTLPVQPPSNNDYLWIFISHLGATYSSFASADSLKAFLRLYEWSGSESKKRKIDAIDNVEIKPVESLFGGSIVRGIEFALTIQEEYFSDSGDIFLFGEILKEFLAQYVSINSFLELVLILKPSDKELRWNSLKGKKCPV
ncbi:MAG: type VI secretion system baseplate subunit TssF [Chitinispirillaceae bacterium]|nr:type VI secretion system baseplate subunit TssF [Chitinispirillaceae bacterium]